MAFWDTSAIVPLCLSESRSQSARRLWRLFENCSVWRETTVEVESTFARLEREGNLAADDYAFALEQLARLELRWLPVESNSRTIEIARSFPRLFGLRSLDSLQLASALVWCKELPKNRNFISADLRLLKAAESLGFNVHDLA